MLVYSSTGVNVRYALVKVTCANVQVAVSGKGSAVPAPFLVPERVVASPLNVPKRLSATTIAHRSAAQYGQNSPPMYSISGFPPLVSGAPVIGFGFAAAFPAPTFSRVAVGTVVVVVTRSASADPVGRVPAPPPPELLDGEFPLVSTNPSTIPTTATIDPPAISNRFRRWACWAAARCAAILSRLPRCCPDAFDLPLVCLLFL